MSHEFKVAPEMYLKTIYTLEAKTGSAKTGDVAKILVITPGSVTNTLEALETKGLVSRDPYRGVKLTNAGRKIAFLVFRRHRLIERLLTDKLHFDWAESHEEACKLEHSLSDRLASSIEKELGNPQTCPHGNPIPNESGQVRATNGQPLSELQSGETAIVSHIPDESAALLKYLASLRMFPGTKIEIEEVAPFSGPMLVRVAANSYPLSTDIAAGIYVNKNH